MEPNLSSESSGAPRVLTAAVPSLVPFIDLGPTNATVKHRILEEIEDLLDTGAFANGPQVVRFENEFATFCGSPHCVGVASGLDAIRLGLLAAGIEAGDEVIVPANTFIATFEAVTQSGGIPVVVDVGPGDYNIDPQAVMAAVTDRTRFIVPVHLYGQLADMKSLQRMATKHSLCVIEDACQAHGAKRDGIRAGTAGLAGAFSFYPTKNLGAIGDAGALVTEDGDLADRVRAMREHGQTAKYQSTYEGYTARLDTIQAIALLAKLPLLEDIIAERRAAAASYLEQLHGVGDLILPPTASRSQPVWHLFVVRTADPTALADFLKSRGIGTGRHYPEPPHLSQAYARLGLKAGSFPLSEAISREGLSLPLFPGIREEQIAYVCQSIASFFQRA